MRVRGSYRAFKALHRDFPLFPSVGLAEPLPAAMVWFFDGNTKLGRGSIGEGRWLPAFAVAV